MPEQAINPPDRTLGQVIRQRRNELGLTQEELAERIGEGVRQAEVSRLEHDYITLPRRSRLDQIARALDLPIGVLLAHSGWTGVDDIPQSGDRENDETVRLQAENSELEEQNEEMRATIEELWATRVDIEAQARNLESEALRHVSGQEQLLTIFDGVEDGVAVVNREGSIVFRNAAFSAMVEHHGDEVAMADEHGQRFTDDMHPLQRAARGEDFTMDITFVGSGKREPYIAHGRPMTTENGAKLGVLTIQDCEEYE